MKSQRIPLVGSLTNRTDSGAVVTSKDQVFVNCFPELTRNALTSQGKVNLLKRYGYSTSQTLADVNYSSCIGATVWTGTGNNYATFSVSRNTGVTRVYDQTGTQVGGDITPNAFQCTSLTETLISNVANLVALIRTNTITEAWYYPSGGAWTKIADADFPPNLGVPLHIVGEPVHKDGYMFVMDQYGRIYNSDLNSLANWSATSYIDASESPDSGAGLALYNNMIVGFGSKTIQFFQNTGNATGSVLTRIPKTINIGISNLINSSGYRYILPVGDTVYFIGWNVEESARHIYKLVGLDAQKISTPAIDEFLNDSSFNETFTAHMAGVVFQNGMSHLIVNGDTTNGAYAYCIETGVWWRFAAIGGGANKINAAVGDRLMVSSGRIIYAKSTNFQDAGSTITATVVTDPLDQGTNRKKFYHAAELIADRRSTSGDTSISWSDDDYQNFNTARTIDLSTGTRRITRLGSTQRNYNNRRAWKITETVNAPFRGEALELWYEEGGT